MTDYDYPRIRDVEVVPVNIRGRGGVALRDPLRYTEEMIVIPQEAIPVVQLFDGNTSIRDIQAELNRRYGEIIPSDDIRNVAEDLDNHLFLYSEHFLKEKRQIDEEFRRSEVRLPIHTGIGYSNNPQELKKELESYFSKAKEEQNIEGGISEKGSKDRTLKGELLAVLSPHISISAGGVCFAHTFRLIKEAPPADLYVILGIGHAGISDLFSGTKKDFMTPFGIVRTEKDFMEDLNGKFDRKLFLGEDLHRTEHTIEFQTVFLNYVLRDTPFAIAPILVSFPYQILTTEGLDEAKGVIEGFISALREALTSFPGKKVIISSVDFAHVGIRYGDKRELTQLELESVKAEDKEMIEIIAGGDAEEFLSHIASDDDKRRVCGFSAIYTMLKVLDNPKGVLLNYDSTVMDDKNSTVTFAGMAFYQ